MKRSLFLACVALIGLSAFARADEGNPKITKIETIAFGPNGLLVIGGNAQVVTVDTGDTKESAWSKKEIANIDTALAGKLGLTVKDIEVKKIAVNPASKKLYVAVRLLKGPQDVILTVDGSGKIAEFSLDKVKFERYPLKTTKDVTRITDVCFVGKNIVAATQAGDTFDSRVFTITPGSKDTSPVSVSTETFHTGHNKWETKAPIICLMPYEESGKPAVVGSFTCTPIVRYSLDDLKPSAKVLGTSVVELGQGNTPRSMFSYEKDGKRYILVNAARNNKKPAFGPSGYWAARVDHDLLKETTNVNQKALWRVKGKNFEPATDRVMIAPEYFGVYQMAKLSDTQAVVIREEKNGGFALRVLALP
ncbi:MAG TPA: hypothetical protein VFE62_01065 [Gemmataceae bacterium]|nr:hypothetical protein [Gemmataceae bacterium]